MSTPGWEGVIEQALAESPRKAAAPERKLQREAERLLRQLASTGKIAAWYHRPDRAPGRGEQAGLPDFLICLPIRTADYGRVRAVRAIELKTPTGRVTDEQARWLGAMGPDACVCRSMADVHAALCRWGVM